MILSPNEQSSPSLQGLLFLSSKNTPDESEENPYESYGEPSVSETWKDRDSQMPGIEKSYWIGILVLGVLGSIGFVDVSYVFASYHSPIYSLFSLIGALALWMCPLIPFALIRLAIHRYNIAKAIDLGTYPGNQRFGLWYLVYSIFVSGLSFIAGFVLFFGICTMMFMMKPNPLSSQQQWEWVYLVVDGLLSIVFAGFLFKIGIPKYR